MARRRSRKALLSWALLLLSAALVAGAAAVATRPRDAKSEVKRALSLLSDGEIEGALAALDRAIELTPADGEGGRSRRCELLARRGDCNLRVHRPTHALEDFQQAQALSPGDPVAWERVGRVLLELGRYDKAALHFDEATLAFPDRARFFRIASGCAEFSISEQILDQGRLLLAQRVLPGHDGELDRAVKRFASTAAKPMTREAIEEACLQPPYGTPERDRAFEFLRNAKQRFAAADRKLADYETSPELDPTFGRVRTEMHLRAGRGYELRRTAEILLKLPVKPEQELELLAIRNTLANGFHDLGLLRDAAQTFTTLRRAYVDRASAERARGDGEGARRDFENARRCVFDAIEERVRAGQGTDAAQILDSLGPIRPNDMLLNFTSGYARYLAGDRSDCVAALEEAANLLIHQRGKSWQFRDPQHRAFVLDCLVDGLAGCARPELAARIAELALPDARDPASLLRRRIAILRPLDDRLAEVVADEFELLKLERDHGENLARFEEDWTRLRGKPSQLERFVAEQADRVRRVYATKVVADRSFGAFFPGGRRGPLAVRTNALATGSKALLRDLEQEPCLTLQVYRNLVAGGHRDQAFVLLFGLVQSQPEVADFRLLLIDHDLAEGRDEEAARELDWLLDHPPLDVDVVRLAYSIARRRGDHDALRRIQERVLGDDPTGAARILAAEVALDGNRPDIALAVARGGGGATPGAEGATLEERLLLGLASRAELALGRAKEAEENAARVLELEPSERSALRVLLASRAARRDGSCEPFIADHTAQIAALGASDCTELAREVFAAGDFAAAKKLLELAQERSTHESGTKLLLADVLFALGRLDGVEKLLSESPHVEASIDHTRRIALVRLARDGVDATWQYLRERVAAGDPESELARFIGLVGCSAGRAQAGVDVLVRHRVALDAATQRFVAVALAAFDAKLPEKSLPAAVAARLRTFSDAEAERDRELERLVSLELASPRHEFLGSLLRLALLADLPTLAPLKRAEERALLERCPSIGSLARAEAAALDAAGDPAAAAAVLARQIEQDPDDLESLRTIALFAADLDAAARERIAAIAARGKLDLPHQRLIAAWNEFAHGKGAEGLALLTSAAEEPSLRAAALCAIARAPIGRRLPDLELGSAPWCEAAAGLRRLEARQDLDRSVVQAAQGAGSDPMSLRIAARRLHGDGARMDAAIRRQLAAALVSQPGPWFEAHEFAIAAAATSGADAATVSALGQALEAAVATWTSGPLPAAGVRALARLAGLARAVNASDLARRYIELANRSCALDPEVLGVHGHLALDEGNVALAVRMFERARAFGSEDPEIAVWLGEYELDARGRPAAAKALGEAAIQLATAPTDAPLRARAQEVVARASYVLGDAEAARVAWVAASRERGEDPRLSLPIALEAFACQTPNLARERIAFAAGVEGPAQALLKRLLALCDEAIASDAAPAK